MGKTKLECLEYVKNSAYYKKFWNKLKPLEVNFVIDTLKEWESLDIHESTKRSNRLFIDGHDEIMNGVTYKNSEIHPKKADGKRASRNNLEAIVEMIQVACSKQHKGE